MLIHQMHPSYLFEVRFSTCNMTSGGLSVHRSSPLHVDTLQIELIRWGVSNSNSPLSKVRSFYYIGIEHIFASFISSSVSQSNTRIYNLLIIHIEISNWPLSLSFCILHRKDVYKHVSAILPPYKFCWSIQTCTHVFPVRCVQSIYFQSISLKSPRYSARYGRWWLEEQLNFTDSIHVFSIFAAWLINELFLPH